ncbi:MAG: 16S rRNA processing protein RimM [Blastocatellia bacterium]|nr:16S rRNA processing protein RimM [Blastocatellia bacterium]
MSESAEVEELISVARIVRPQGRRGEVIADLLTDFPERFSGLGEIRLRSTSGATSILKLESSWLHGGRIVLKLSGCDNIDQAEELRGTLVLVSREQLVELPADSYYDFDLIGCAVVTTNAAPVGRVSGIQRYGAAPLLAVEDEEKREHLIPLTLDICVEIDVARKRITIDPPEGLLELQFPVSSFQLGRSGKLETGNWKLICGSIC